MTYERGLREGCSEQKRSFSALRADSSYCSAVTEVEIEDAFHSPTPRCHTLRDMSIRSSSSSSSTSDPRLGSALCVNVGVDTFGRALNCGVLGRSNRSAADCEQTLWAPGDNNCSDHLQQAFVPADPFVNVHADPRIFSQRSQLSLDKSESSSTIGSKRSWIEAPAWNERSSDGEDHQGNSRRGTRDKLLEVAIEQRSSTIAHSSKDDHQLKHSWEFEEDEFSGRRRSLDFRVDRNNRDVSNFDFDSRMPASPECMPVPSRHPGTQSQFAEESLRRFNDHRVEFLNTELQHPASAPRFIEVGSIAASRVVKREGEAKRENELQQRQKLAADGGDSSSSQLSKVKFAVVGSKGNLNESESQFATSSGYRVNNVQGKNQQQQAQDSLNVHGEETVECITNVNEEDEFGFPHQQGGRKRPFTARQSQFPQGVLEEISQGTSQGERRSAVTTHSKFEACKESSSTSAAGPTPVDAGTNPRANDSSNLRSGDVVVEQIHQQLPGAAGIDCTIPEVLQTGRDIKGGRAEAHFRKSSPAAASHVSVPSEDRRVRTRLLDSPMAITGRREPTEDASCAKVARPSRPSAGKDRHSKVNTAKGPRDRRVRLSVPTAVQFYDVQDRLGYDQPSKAVEWLIKNAKTAIDELGTLPTSGSHLPSSVVSDVTHSSPYLGASSHGLVNPVASGSFPSGLGGTFGDHVGNQMPYFMDPTIQQISSFGHSPTHIRDVGGALGLSHGHSSNVASHGPLAGLGFCFQNEQADLSRGCPGVSIGGGKLVEFQGAPLARSESRVKARERARERAKEKCGGRDDGKSSSDGCSPSLQSPSSQHQNLIPGSFSTQSSLQGLVHSHAQNLLRPSLQQSSLSSVFNATLSGIMQSSQPGTLHNLIMQNPSLHSSLADQSLRQSFQSSLSNTMQQQQPGQMIPSFEGSSAIAHGPIDRDSAFTSEHGALSFASAACRSRAPSDPNPSISQPLALASSSAHCLSGFGVPPSVSMQIGPDFQMESTSELMHIRPGLSSGPFGTDFRHQPESTSHSYITDQQRAIHGYPRTPSQLIVPNYSGTSTGGGSTGQDDSPKDTAADVASLYYSNSAPNTRMRNLQVPSIASMPMDRMSFSSGDGNVSCDYPSGLQLQAMSPGTTSSPPYQSSSSQIQMPARIQGLEDDEFDNEKLKGASSSSSPPLHSLTDGN